MQRCKRKWRANAVLTELSTNFHNWRHIRDLAFLRPPHHDRHIIPHHRYGVQGQNSRLDVTRVLTLGCSGMGHLDLGTGQIEHCQGDSDSFGALLDKTLPNTERYSQSCCDVTTVVVIFFPWWSNIWRYLGKHIFLEPMVICIIIWQIHWHDYICSFKHIDLDNIEQSWRYEYILIIVFITLW